MHKTLVFVIFSLQSSVFHHRTERFVKFDAVLHHDLCYVRVGRGSDEIDQPSSWAGAITSKPPVNAEKA